MRAIVAGLVLASLGVLAGCSSGSDGGEGGGGGGGGGGAPDAPLTFEGIDALGMEIGGEIAGQALTDPATLPDSGTVTYQGAIGLGPVGIIGDPDLPDEDAAGDDGEMEASDMPSDAPPPDVLLGELELRVAFDQDQVTGTAGNFQTELDGAWDGTLDIAEVTIFRDVDLENYYTYGGQIGGTLTQDGNAIVVDGDLNGDFIGTDGRYMAGDITGQLTADTVYELGGGFVAER